MLLQIWVEERAVTSTNQLYYTKRSHAAGSCWASEPKFLWDNFPYRCRK